MPARYASTTEVPIAKSKVAVETLLIQHGAKSYATGWDEGHDKIQFELFGRTIRFVLPRPDPKDKKYRLDKRGWTLSDSGRLKLIDQADRQRWRALYLVVRAKLEAVEAGIAIFEQEFLAFVVMPNGLTIGDQLVPQLQAGAPLQLTAGDTVQ